MDALIALTLASFIFGFGVMGALLRTMTLHKPLRPINHAWLWISGLATLWAFYNLAGVLCGIPLTWAMESVCTGVI